MWMVPEILDEHWIISPSNSEQILRGVIPASNDSKSKTWIYDLKMLKEKAPNILSQMVVPWYNALKIT